MRHFMAQVFTVLGRDLGHGFDVILANYLRPLFISLKRCNCLPHWLHCRASTCALTPIRQTSTSIHQSSNCATCWQPCGSSHTPLWSCPLPVVLSPRITDTNTSSKRSPSSSAMPVSFLLYFWITNDIFSIYKICCKLSLGASYIHHLASKRCGSILAILQPQRPAQNIGLWVKYPSGRHRRHGRLAISHLQNQFKECAKIPYDCLLENTTYRLYTCLVGSSTLVSTFTSLQVFSPQLPFPLFRVLMAQNSVYMVHCITITRQPC